MDHRRVRCLQELGLREPASEDDIKKAYKAAAFKYHPDKNPGKDTTGKFQQISAAYKFLTQGDEYLRQAQEDDAEFSILRFLFPWLFQPQSFFRTTNPFFGYYNDLSDEEDNYVPPRTYTAGGGQNVRGTYTASGAYTARGGQTAHGGQTARGAYTAGGGHTASGAYTTGGGASGTSEHFKQNTNFTHTSAQHGQFFQETQSKGKAAKKRNREAKRATKLAADRERSESAKGNTSTTEQQYRPTKAKSPTPDLSGQQQTRKEGNSKPGQERESSQPPENSQASNNTEDKKNGTEDQTNKKSKKRAQMEQKQRDKEMKEIAEELVRQEKERKEKQEKKRALQEEKDRQEHEARQKQEEEKAEEERQRLEELRKLMGKKDEEKKRKKREAERMKKLLSEFDSGTFLDENGDFKYTDPEMANIIRRHDVNHLGNAGKNTPHKKFEAVNGLLTENLIKLQEAEIVKGQPKPLPEKALESPNHAKLGPDGSRPQEEHREHPGQQSNRHREYQPRHQHPHQPHPPQFYNHPPPPLRQPTVPVPYWSSSQPPPPLHSMNTNIPRPSVRFNHGHALNKTYRNYTFTHQGFQGNI